MTVEQAIKELKKYSIPCGKYVEAYNMAIKSLEAWDKVIEELEKEYIEDRSIGVKVYQLGISKALDIIEEHLKEIEE